MSKQDTGTFWLIGGACAAAAAGYWWLTRQAPQIPQTTDTQSETGTLPTAPSPYDQLGGSVLHPLENPGFFDSLKAILYPL